MLRPLQRLLAVIYDVPTSHDVEDFLFSDRSLLPAQLRQSGGEEQVLVAERPGAAAISVYLDADVLQRLTAANPLQALHGGNLADFCTALEGVSHFQYLSWNLHHDRPVSLLELELQAEVDKYVISLWLLRAQQPGRFPRELRRLLFERVRLDPALPAGRSALYATATSYAARFCQRLEHGLASERRVLRTDAVAELRRFYRWGTARKLHHIEGLNA